MKVQSRVRRPVAGIVLAVVMASSVLTACQVAKAGAKCRTTDFGRDSTYVLQCKKGKWVRIMTIRDYLLLVKKIQDSQNPGTPGGGPAPAPVGPSPIASGGGSWNLVGDVGLLNPDSADGVNDGIGKAAAIIGNTAYIGGSFSQITDNTTTLTRANVAAFDITTGQPTGFVANTDGNVTSLATDGTKLFIGGTFSTVNGSARDHFAAVDPSTGTVIGGGWVRNFSNNVYSMAVSNSKLYVGGVFTNVGGTPRGRVAALSLADGSLDTTFAPTITGTTVVGGTARGGVDAIAAEANDSAVYIGGYYTTVTASGGGTAPSTRLSKLDPNGDLVPMTWSGLPDSALDLSMGAANKVLVAVGGDGNRVSRYDTQTGNLDWTTGTYCNGDAQAVLGLNGAVFGGYHQKCNDDATRHLLKQAEADGSLQPFKPVFDGYWGVFDIAGSSSALVVAGQFEHVNGALHKGFAIFTPTP